MAADEIEYETVYADLFVRAGTVAMAILHNWSDAEEIASETMVRALSSWRRVRTYSTPWVTRVATNLSIDMLRHQKRSGETTFPGPADATSVDRIALVSALDGLPSRQRQAMVLRYVVGLSGAETAEVMGLSPKTVKTHLRRGTEAMRATLGSDWKETADV